MLGFKLSRQASIITLLVIDSIFFLLEIVVGYMVGSLALVADSFHMLNDVMSLIVALWAVKLASRTDYSPKYSYGWQRAEVLGALVNGVFLLALCFSIFVEAIQRFFEPRDITQPILVLVVGSAGLASNLIGLLLFHEHGHGHSHGDHSHQNGKTPAPTSTIPIINAQTQEPENRTTWGSISSIDSIYIHPAQNREAVVRQAQQMSYTEEDDIKMQARQNAIAEEQDQGQIDETSESTIVNMLDGDDSSSRIVRNRDSLRKARNSNQNNTTLRSRSRSNTRARSLISTIQKPDNHQHNHDHTHGNTPEQDIDHSHSHSHGKSNGSLNMRGVFLHVLGDALGNIGVIASALFISLTTYSWRFYADPLVSLVITCIIFASALPLCRSAAFILLQGVPNSIPLEDVRAEIRKLPGILSIHELHIWQLSDAKVIASVHVLVSRSYCYMNVASSIRKVLHSFDIHSSTIQPEFVHLAEEEIDHGALADGQHMSDNIPDVNAPLLSQNNSYGAIGKSKVILDQEANLVAKTNGDREPACLLKCDEDDACAQNACCPPDVKII